MKSVAIFRRELLILDQGFYLVGLRGRSFFFGRAYFRTSSNSPIVDIRTKVVVKRGKISYGKKGSSCRFISGVVSRSFARFRFLLSLIAFSCFDLRLVVQGLPYLLKYHEDSAVLLGCGFSPVPDLYGPPTRPAIRFVSSLGSI
ncbi:hypothetical protein GW17_00050418 [Ensete ventricosum]|nr:hypothetical protein GW17_00050418 [Ensete ventricosum]RZR94569.1 hypothetical protein BHM03_00023307 [Ensete ventricosum]